MTAAQLSTEFFVIGRALPLRYMVWYGLYAGGRPRCWQTPMVTATSACCLLVQPVNGQKL